MLLSAGVGSYYAWYYAWYAIGLALAIVAVRRFRRRLHPRVRRLALMAVAVLAVRLVLFDNPLALRGYQASLSPDSLGQRQGGVLDLEIRKYRREIDQPKLPYMAVGSSQVGAIFYHWPKEPDAPAVYSLAGMKALDFVLHARSIAAYNPARVVLYLSAFDMTGSPELFSLPLAPPDPAIVVPVLRQLRSAGLTWAEIGPSMHGYIGSQLFPEYRYSFVFRAFLRDWFGGAPRPELPAGATRLTEFSSYFDPQWLEYNFGFFHDFLEFCVERGIEVVIAEGQVNPAGVTPAIANLNRAVRDRFLDLRSWFPNLHYIPSSEVYEFRADEYHDFTHVLPDAASRYTERLAEYLKRRSATSSQTLPARLRPEPGARR